MNFDVTAEQRSVELGKTPVQTRDLIKQMECGRTMSRDPGTNDIQIKSYIRVKGRCWTDVISHGKINVSSVRVVKERRASRLTSE
jgi:hypothetical protein